MASEEPLPGLTFRADSMADGLSRSFAAKANTPSLLILIIDGPGALERRMRDTTRKLKCFAFGKMLKRLDLTRIQGSLPVGISDFEVSLQRNNFLLPQILYKLPLVLHRRLCLPHCMKTELEIRGDMAQTLENYRRERDLTRMAEPSGTMETPHEGKRHRRRFVVQKHHALSLHYDLRLEEGGVLKNWALPKGLSLDPANKRLAVEVEDHPLEYGDFEGNIPEGEYGAGRVIVWDRGTFVPIGGKESFREMLGKGAARIRLSGEKLNGGFALVQTRWGGKGKNWLFIKERGDQSCPGYDMTAMETRSVLSGRDVDELA
jgi:DNA ligase D-like protein (predicted 3'-phosphoesterase)